MFCYTVSMRTLSFTIEPDFDGCSVKDALSKKALVSDTLCSKLKRRKASVCLNGLPVYVTVPVHTGDILTVAVGDPEKDPTIRPMPFPLSVLYEDDDLVVIDKPNGFAVHPSRDPSEVTLENALAAYLTGTDNPHPVSRLDRGTTGLLTVAKSGWAHSWMKGLQHSGGMQKAYLAICTGIPEKEHDIIRAPIGYYEGSSYQRIVRPDGAPSVTEYTVLSVQDGLSLLRLVPHTGRTHQLRVHMAYIGHPLLGDWLYGKQDDRIHRPALHAAELAFIHPLTKQTIHLTSPLPEDMRSFFSFMV